MGNKNSLFHLFLFVFLIALCVHLILYERNDFDLKNEISLYENVSGLINFNSQEMCTTKWYKNLHIEFNAFSVNYFEKVIFMMDPIYSNIIKDGFYQCIFFHFGKNQILQIFL